MPHETPAEFGRRTGFRPWIVRSLIRAGRLRMAWRRGRPTVEEFALKLDPDNAARPAIETSRARCLAMRDEQLARDGARARETALAVRDRQMAEAERRARELMTRAMNDHVRMAGETARRLVHAPR